MFFFYIYSESFSWQKHVNSWLKSSHQMTLTLRCPSQEVGMPADYVNKLARMFQDIKVSEDLNQSFKEMHKHKKLALPGKEILVSLCCFTFAGLSENVLKFLCIWGGRFPKSSCFLWKIFCF